MQYLITFLEGLISFISPCMLPMLPVYISYFSGGDKGQKNLVRSLCFVLGFSFVFCMLGLFAGTLGAMLKRYEEIIQVVCGMIIILFGVSYLGVFTIPFLKGISKQTKVTGAFSAFLFGMVYSVSHMPCVGVFLGSALAMASASGTAVQGVLMLAVYSLGIGIPFIISAQIIEKLKDTLNTVKKYYHIINPVCGVFLIVVGILMCFGILHRLTGIVS